MPLFNDRIRNNLVCLWFSFTIACVVAYMFVAVIWKLGPEVILCMIILIFDFIGINLASVILVSVENFHQGIKRFAFIYIVMRFIVYNVAVAVLLFAFNRSNPTIINIIFMTSIYALWNLPLITLYVEAEGRFS